MMQLLLLFHNRVNELLFLKKKHLFCFWFAAAGEDLFWFLFEQIFLFNFWGFGGWGGAGDELGGGRCLWPAPVYFHLCVSHLSWTTVMPVALSVCKQVSVDGALICYTDTWSLAMSHSVGLREISCWSTSPQRKAPGEEENGGETSNIMRLDAALEWICRGVWQILFFSHLVTERLNRFSAATVELWCPNYWGRAPVCTDCWLLILNDLMQQPESQAVTLICGDFCIILMVQVFFC